METTYKAQGDGEGSEATGDLRLVPEPDEKPETYTCWDCGEEFVVWSTVQRQCKQCFVADKCS